MPTFGSKQIGGSAPGTFYTNSSCYWKLTVPTEWSDNTVLKIKITKLANATCFYNYGGTQSKANQ